ncbi:oxidoreductase NAD-binding domain-containing protein 1-like isoform X2 [Physella acuta]|nr:oxidoreductase NAD-binding domain-containing protein 1-like isoform X2 [Physella acuta]XP_059160038.1 oxidoreductase NAD-binding domain-containing protein 1-like isoform X2 [Physella acuta]
MSVGRESDHISRTAGCRREEEVSTAEVVEIQRISGTVRLLKLYVYDSFTFKAGQWVDMFIPGISVIGGFSICSSPHLLATERIIHLAVKFADHPPAYWVHKKCKVGDKVQLRAGGDFYYDPPDAASGQDLLLLAGGVGINPLFSMLQHFLHINPGQSSPSGDNPSRKAALLYSAQTPEELIFKDDLLKLSEKKHVFIKKFITRCGPQEMKGNAFSASRIQLEDIKTALIQLDKQKSDVYICGPYPFIQTMEEYCVKLGINNRQIHFEKWW